MIPYTGRLLRVGCLQADAGGKQEEEDMKYDFDSIIDRRNTNSLKWNVADGELPMWVADMDFATAPEIRSALQKRVEHGVFGYSDLSDEWYQAYIGGWQKRHGFTIDRDWLIFSAGVVATISSVVRKLTTPAEKVLVQSPCYNIFYNSILNNGRVVLENELIYHEDGYKINWELLEEQLADPQTTLMILCNPHNPVGRIWSREELTRIGRLCAEYHVVVLSDEIHCDLTDPGKEYIPFASASDICRDNSVTCIAPTKTFNIAGLQTSAVVVPNPALRHRVWRGLNTDEVAEPNAFAVDATVCAYTQGAGWLDELRIYLKDNKDELYGFLSEYLPEITVQPCDATYLMWLNCAAVSDDVKELCSYIRRESGLYLAYGGDYGKGGAHFIRWNVACPRCVLKDGLSRFRDSIHKYRTGNQ